MADAAAESGESVVVTLVNLSGEIVWGPEPVPSRESLDALTWRAAKGMGKLLHRVCLVKDGEVLKGRSTLAATGFAGECQLQVVVEDATEKIREIQAKMGRPIQPGLSDAEVAQVEEKYDFIFTPELREFLQVGIPAEWHNWRKLLAVEKGLAEDTVSQQWMWHATPENEGDVPEELWTFLRSTKEDPTLDDVIALARKHKPIPVFKHRMMVAVPHQPGLPVLSLHQFTDNIIYGRNFWEWLENDKMVEKGIIPEEWKQSSLNLDDGVADIPFWGLTM